MAETHYAIVFKKEFEPGDHWDHKAPEHDSDRKQHWKKGDLWSVGTVIADPLPFHLEAIELSAPPEPGDTWDREHRCFIPWHANKTAVQEQIDQHQAEIDRLKAHL